MLSLLTVPRNLTANILANRPRNFAWWMRCLRGYLWGAPSWLVGPGQRVDTETDRTLSGRPFLHPLQGQCCPQPAEKDWCVWPSAGYQDRCWSQTVSRGSWPSKLECVPWKIAAMQNDHRAGAREWRITKAYWGSCLVRWALFLGLEMNFWYHCL